METVQRPTGDHGIWWPAVPPSVAQAGASLDGQFRWAAGLVCALTLAAAFAGDFMTGPDLTWSIFYVAPVALAAWLLGRGATAVTVFVGFALMLLADFLGGGAARPAPAIFWNAAVGGAFLMVMARMLRLLRHALVQERELARTDWLTGLPNARAFLEMTTHEIARSRRTDTPLTLAYMDLDGFKALNDSQGHAAGDAILQQVAALLRHGLRDVDVVARLGGDEFALLLPDTSAEDATLVLDRVHATIGTATGLVSAPIRISTGAVTVRGAADADDLIRQADAAMYEAKRQGGNQVRVMDMAG
ncbi:MAG TPA: GGDEF domain-containing protein [Longimicrobiales bacterium]|nr:GGDEF domain-containing protein [Longimicrobiales bacterium]